MANENEKAVLFIGSNRPIVGREQEAMSHWMETGPWLESAQRAGYFARWDGYWLTAHGGRLNAVITCYGDRAKLDEWRRTDLFEAWVFRASNCVSDLAIIPGVAYAAAAETMARRKQALASK